MKRPHFLGIIVALLSLFGAQSSSAQSFGYPNIYLIPYGCTGQTVIVSDSNAKDEGLSNVELLFDSLGVFGHKIESYNVDFDGAPVDVQSGDLVTQFRIKVTDPLDTAYAAIFAVNHSGRERVVEWHYKPVGLHRLPNVLSFDTVLLGQRQCATIQLVSTSDTALIVSADEPLQSSKFSAVGVAGTPYPLKKGDRFSMTICFRGTDTAQVRDTLWLDLQNGCYRVPIPLEAHPRAPIIYAEDLEFKGEDTGTTDCKSLRVWNLGTANLRASPGVIDPPFQFSSVAAVNISPGSYSDFDLCFSPLEYRQFSSSVVWSTNIDAQLVGLYGKSQSNVLGIAERPGLHWDTSGGFYDPANGTPDTIQFYIKNTSKTAGKLDSIHLAGQNPGDFRLSAIVSNDLLQPRDSLGVTIRFTPDLFNTAVNRSAIAYIVSNGVFVDSLFLNGRTGQAGVGRSRSDIVNISLYPNPANGEILHVSSQDREVLRYQILNILGSSIRSGFGIDATSFDIPISDLPRGDYLLRLDFATGLTAKMFSIAR